eukprot:1494035-Rhodomonas_salina.1
MEDGSAETAMIATANAEDGASAAPEQPQTIISSSARAANSPASAEASKHGAMVTFDGNDAVDMHNARDEPEAGLAACEGHEEPQQTAWEATGETEVVPQGEQSFPRRVKWKVILRKDSRDEEADADSSGRSTNCQLLPDSVTAASDFEVCGEESVGTSATKCGPEEHSVARRSEEMNASASGTACKETTEVVRAESLTSNKDEQGITTSSGQGHEEPPGCVGNDGSAPNDGIDEMEARTLSNLLNLGFPRDICTQALQA